MGHSCAIPYLIDRFVKVILGKGTEFSLGFCEVKHHSGKPVDRYVIRTLAIVNCSTGGTGLVLNELDRLVTCRTALKIRNKTLEFPIRHGPLVPDTSYGLRKTRIPVLHLFHESLGLIVRIGSKPFAVRHQIRVHQLLCHPRPLLAWLNAVCSRIMENLQRKIGFDGKDIFIRIRVFGNEQVVVIFIRLSCRIKDIWTVIDQFFSSFCGLVQIVFPPVAFKGQVVVFSESPLEQTELGLQGKRSPSVHPER